MVVVLPYLSQRVVVPIRVQKARDVFRVCFVSTMERSSNPLTNRVKCVQSSPDRRFHYSAAPTSSKSYDDDGDILLQTISEEDAEYGGSFDDVRTLPSMS